MKCRSPFPMLVAFVTLSLPSKGHKSLITPRNTPRLLAVWQRLVKVGLSRARESIIFLASESEMEEPYLRPLRKLMTPAILIQEQGNLRWQAISSAANRTAGPNRVGEEVTQYRNACMAQQIADRKQMSPILSREQQRLSNLTLDGKPRLVRGVAGSGKSIVLCNWMAK